MRNVVLARVDDRLIHGEVVSVWGPALGINQYVIVDDEVAANKITKRVIKALCPSSAGCGIYSVEKGAEVLQKEQTDKKEKIMVLVKSPITLLRLVELGIPFEKINLGGMGLHEGRKPFFKTLSCTKEEVGAIRELVNQEIYVFYQLVPEQKATDIRKCLRTEKL